MCPRARERACGYMDLSLPVCANMFKLTLSLSLPLSVKETASNIKQHELLRRALVAGLIIELHPVSPCKYTKGNA